MRGVNKVKNSWQVSFGKNIQEYYSSKQEAVNRRTELEKRYGVPRRGGRKKDYEGIEIGNFIVIGDTGETYNGIQKVLVKNKISGKLSTNTIGTLKQNKGDGFNNVGKGYKRVVGVYKHRNKFESRIHIQSQSYYLGVFNTEKEAFDAYQLALNNWKRFEKKPKRGG